MKETCICTDLYQFRLSATVQVMSHSIPLPSQAILRLYNNRGKSYYSISTKRIQKSQLKAQYSMHRLTLTI